MSTLYNTPRLEGGWISFQEAADIMGISLQGFHQVAFKQGLFDTVRWVGAESKPFYLVQREEVERVSILRTRTKLEREANKEQLQQMRGGK